MEGRCSAIAACQGDCTRCLVLDAYQSKRFQRPHAFSANAHPYTFNLAPVVRRQVQRVVSPIVGFSLGAHQASADFRFSTDLHLH